MFMLRTLMTMINPANNTMVPNENSLKYEKAMNVASILSELGIPIYPGALDFKVPEETLIISMVSSSGS
jgi:hypothetical protein